MESPVTGRDCAHLVKSIDPKKLIRSYRDHFDIDVTLWLGELDAIQIYECQETGYRFFFPHHIAGGENLYRQLQDYAWYYIPFRWEHNYAKGWIQPGFKVLEVGCGTGEFLKKLAEDSSLELGGLEINLEAIARARESGIPVSDEDLAQHANRNPAKYDMVCSFQVMEHIPQVREFLSAQLKCLKDGGLILIAVPNNDSFIKNDPGDVLNQPPHHMGLWSENSLARLAEVFNMELQALAKEPLQEYHLQWYVRIWVSRYVTSAFSKRIFYWLRLDKPVLWLVKLLSHYITGHTIVAVFRK